MQYEKLMKVVAAYCAENQIALALSKKMPEGYENAYGTFDVTVNTLYMNFAMFENAPDEELLFYLFHELRHAVQYLHPDRFGEQLRLSLPYVVLYDGTCFKLTDNRWQKCHLEGTETDFTNAYLSLPYERDANEFAYQQTAAFCGYTAELNKLYDMWKPDVVWTDTEYKDLFRLIDRKIG